MEAVPGLAAWDAMMAESDISKSIDADMQANTADFHGPRNRKQPGVNIGTALTR